MNLDDHPILLIYLLGSAAACVASVVITLEAYAVSWFFKGNILRKNLEKIQSPSEHALLLKLGGFAVVILINAVMSWIAVLICIFQFFMVPLSALRDAISSTPEDIKQLRFPLHNNPNLSRESVWAYLQALKAKVGQGDSAAAMEYELLQIEGYYPHFHKQGAFNALKSLNVVHPDLLEDLSIILKQRGKLDSQD
jgi:hypothetical protein